jgi:hypothetical protein
LSDLNEQLQVNLQINEAIRARNELLNHSGNQLKSQIDLAWELCSAMECGENIDALKGKILSTREAIGSLSASAEKAAGKTKSMNKATEESASIFQKAGKFIKTALGYLTGWTLMKKGVEWMKNAFDSMIPTIKNLAKNTFNFFKTAISYIGRAKEGLIEMSYRLGQVTEYTRALERVRDKFGDLEKGTSKILKDSLRPMRSEFNQLTASGVTFSAVFGRGPDGMAKAIEFNAELMEKLNGGTERLRNEIGQNIAAMAIYRKGMGFTAEQQATLVALADSQGKNIVEVQHQYAKFSLEMGKRFGLDSKVIGRAMADMTANVGDFGTLSTKQLAQVATYTQKLGIETKALQGVIKKYDDFENAAKSAAMLNQTFGMQVDVLKLMKEEDPAARLNQLQRSFQATGRSYDQLSRAERRRLAELSGLDDKSAALAFSQNGLSMSYEEVQAAGEETEDKFKDLNETLKELSKNIAKNFYDPNKYKSFFEAFLGGFNRGIELSAPFMQVMRNIQRSLRIVEMAGYRLGKVFVDVFPGVKQLFEGLAKYFDPATASSRMNQVVSVFTKFFKTLQKGPEHVRQAMLDLWNSLSKDFFKIFNLAGEGSKGMMLDGLKKILTTAINMAMSFAEIIVKEVANGIRKVIGLLIKGSEERKMMGKFYEGVMEGPSIDWKSLFGESWEGLKDSFTNDLLPALGDLGKLIWNKIKQGFRWVTKKIDEWLTETFEWWPNVKKSLQEFYQKIEKWFLDLAQSVKDFFAPFIEAYEKDGWEKSIGGKGENLEKLLKEKFKFIFDFFDNVKTIYNDFKKAWEEGEWFTKGEDGIETGLRVELEKKISSALSSIGEYIWNLFLNQFKNEKGEAKGFGSELILGIFDPKEGESVMGNFAWWSIRALGKALWAGVKGLGSMLLSILESIFVDFPVWLAGKLGDLLNFLLVDVIAGGLGYLAGSILSIGVHLDEFIFVTLPAKINAAAEWLNKKITEIGEWFSNMWKPISDWWENFSISKFIDDMYAKFVAFIKSIEEKFKQLAEWWENFSIKDFAKQKGEQLGEWTGEKLNAIEEGVKEAGKSIVNGVVDIKDSVVTWWNKPSTGFWTKMTDAFESSAVTAGIHFGVLEEQVTDNLHSIENQVKQTAIAVQNASDQMSVDVPMSSAPNQSQMTSEMQSSASFTPMTDNLMFTPIPDDKMEISPDKIKEAAAKVSNLQQMEVLTKKIESLGSVETKLDDAIKTLPNESKMTNIRQKMEQVVESFNTLNENIGVAMDDLKKPDASVKKLDADSMGAIGQIASLKETLVKIGASTLSTKDFSRATNHIKNSLNNLSAVWNADDGIKKSAEKVKLDDTTKINIENLSNVISLISVFSESMKIMIKNVTTSENIKDFFKNLNSSIKQVKVGVENIEKNTATNIKFDEQKLKDYLQPMSTIQSELTTVSDLSIPTDHIDSLVANVHASLEKIDGIFIRLRKILPNGISATAIAIARELTAMDNTFKSLPKSEVIATAVKVGEAFNGSTNGTLTFKHENININLAVNVEMSAEQIARGVIKARVKGTEGKADKEVRVVTDPNVPDFEF